MWDFVKISLSYRLRVPPEYTFYRIIEGSVSKVHQIYIKFPQIFQIFPFQNPVI